MCTPIQIDPATVDLSGDGLKDKATGTVGDGAPLPKVVASEPAGTGNPTPSAASNTTPRKDTPALAADEGRVFVPGADYPDGGASAVGAVAATPAVTLSGTVSADNGTPASGTGTPAASDPISDQNTLLINSLTTLAHKFSDTTAGILGAQADAAQALTGGFLNLSDQQQKALDAANELRKNTGQAARKPSYSLSAAKVSRANANGSSSTMLTGSGGVPTNQLALGRAQLLGAGA